jgi:hypothetical protein
MFVSPPNSYLEIIIPKETILGRWGFQEVIRTQEKNSREKDWCLSKERLREFMGSSYEVGTQNRK